MAKGQQRSSREAKKPKQDKSSKTAPTSSPFSTLPPGKPSATGGKKK
jgi:hypothetical protein